MVQTGVLQNLVNQIGDKCSGSTAGSNPARVGSTPTSPAKILPKYRPGDKMIGLLYSMINTATGQPWTRMEKVSLILGVGGILVIIILPVLYVHFIR